MKLPLIKRSTHEGVVNQFEYRIRGYQITIQGLKEELELANSVAKNVLPRLVNIKVSDRPSENFRTWRVCVDLHRDMVERAFTHGGDEHEIRYLAELLSREIKRKMISFNFARCETLGGDR